MADIEMWIEVLQTVGVPSVVCAASFYYIYKISGVRRRERSLCSGMRMLILAFLVC
mgnify:CR=1 FL=1